LQLDAQAPFTQLKPVQQLAVLVQIWPANPQLTDEHKLPEQE
jgi:hypothetical protein